MTYDDWKTTDDTPEPEVVRCTECGHPDLERYCDCPCCHEPADGLFVCPDCYDPESLLCQCEQPANVSGRR